MLQLPIVVKLETSIQGHSILDFFLCLNSRKTLKPEIRLASSLTVLELSLKLFSGRLVEGYKDLLRSDRLDIFAKRQHLSVSDYGKTFSMKRLSWMTLVLLNSLITKPELSV